MILYIMKKYIEKFTISGISVVFALFFPVLIYAATADIAQIAFIDQPGASLEVGEVGEFTLETRDEAGNPEAADSSLSISLTDNDSGTFYEYNSGSCTGTELTGGEVVVASGESTVSFCYENQTAGSYDIQAAIETEATGAGGYDSDATYGAENVWTNGYAFVSHNGAAVDSTANGNSDGVGQGGISAGDTPGQIGDATTFDGADDYIKIPDSSSLRVGGRSLSVSAWVDYQDTGNFWIGVGKLTFENQHSDPFFNYLLGVSDTDEARLHLAFTNNSYEAVEGQRLDGGSRYLMTGTYDGSAMKIFVDGQESASISQTKEVLTSSSSLHIGANAVGDELADGFMDEVRVSSVSRSAAWISAEYANQSTTTDFYTIGAQETGSGTGWYNDDWTYRIPLTIDNTQIDSTLTDFPVYVDFSDLSSDFFTNIRSQGQDIRLTTADGQTELAYELVSIDTQNETGELHFQADSIDDTTDTTFYIYYGNTQSSTSASISFTPAPEETSSASGGAGDKLDSRENKKQTDNQTDNNTDDENTEGEGEERRRLYQTLINALQQLVELMR